MTYFNFSILQSKVGVANFETGFMSRRRDNFGEVCSLRSVSQVLFLVSQIMKGGLFFLGGCLGQGG